MKYRIIEDGRWYKVQTRPWWWPFWATDRYYEWYDKPQTRQRHGGFFGDIISEEKVYGDMTSLHRSLTAAKERIQTLKKQKEGRKEKKPPAKVVFRT